MITLGSRYVDYGLVGGLFLILNGAILAILGNAPNASLATLLNSFIGAAEMPKTFESTFNTVMISILVVIVFASGLLLDLLGSILAVYEMRIFVSQFKRNETWARPLLQSYAEFIQDDLEGLIEAHPYSWYQEFTWTALASLFRRLILTFKSFGRFNRIEGVLMSHLIFNSDEKKTQFVLENLHTCRVARSISSGLYITAISSFIFLFVPILSDRKFVDRLDTYFTATVIGTVIIVLSIYVLRRAYLRFCSSLFAAIYVLNIRSSATQALPATPVG
jgi:hypothetical protein